MVSIILDSKARNTAKIEDRVEFIYHPLRPDPKPPRPIQRTPRMNARITPAPAHGELDAFWMPFTANRQFKGNPRLLARAEGMHSWTADGRQVIDAVAGLWCVNAGHGRREI